jgi:tetratricopeptide (TPR) repeat protein
VTDQITRLSAIARKGVQSRDWATVNACATEILKRDRKNAEGYFLSGLAAKASGRKNAAIESFRKALKQDPGRYDAALELAWQYWVSLRLAEALELLKTYEPALDKSPVYLELAANVYSRLGLHENAYLLYQKAVELQPEINRFQESLAKCAMFVGHIDQARGIYEKLLQQYPNHQRNHYQLSRLARAENSKHIDQMKGVLKATALPAEKNIFLYYALAKELEDLEQWEPAFDYYRMAGDAAGAVAKAAGYDVQTDIDLIDHVIDVCNTDWLNDKAGSKTASPDGKTPVFIVGLPRTGTTLTERIIASHSLVESADETQFLQIAIQRAAGMTGGADMKPETIETAARKNIGQIANGYLNTVRYKLGDAPFFIDKLPENFLYLGFIAKAFPDARIIHLKRNPMDACFAMYKQSFFRFAYNLDDIAEYYLAYHRLAEHWEKLLKDRLIEVEYETLVSDSETQTRLLLNKIGLEFEQACLDFHLNETPSATASAVQVREKAHTRSVNNWRHWESQLQALQQRLESAGISTC